MGELKCVGSVGDVDLYGDGVGVVCERDLKDEWVDVFGEWGEFDGVVLVVDYD